MEVVPEMTPYDPNNVFAKILRGELPSYQVYADDVVVAFLDISPINPGHLLVIPRKGVASAADLDDETAGHLFQVGLRLSRALRNTDLPCEGVNFYLADGEKAGQEVFHVHLHVVPRRSGDGFGLRFGPQNRKQLPAYEMAAIAEQIRTALGNPSEFKH